MKVLKILGLLLLLLIIGISGYFFYLKNLLTPSYSGEEALKGLSDEVAIYFTEHGIPHVYAQKDTDAYRTLGYIHAKERLWQMDLLRHVGSGRLSELFGKDMIKNDVFLRTVGLNTYAKKSAQMYIQRKHESLPLMQAYIDGINQYIANNAKPLEYILLGLDVEPFKIQNIFETLTYMAFSFSNAHITDPVLTELSNKLDSTYLKDLNIYHYKGESTIKSFDNRYSDYSEEIVATLTSFNIPEFIGSNSWVLSGKKTNHGKVIFANDPHIAFSQPCVWYESHLNYPSNEYYGYHIPGAPFPLLMHSEQRAVGLTMFENDDMDFYVEDIHPEDSMKYRYKGEWVSMTSREETIHVKGEESHIFNVRATKHGPIVSDIIKEKPLEDVVAMHWVTTSYPNYMAESVYGFIHAKNITELEKAISNIHGPGLNVMYGDAEGNIAWWAIGKLMKRRDERTSKTFYDGSTGIDDPDSSYTFDKNPHAINPPWGYVYSANNQPDTVDGVLYSGYYLPDDRGERITQFLDASPTLSVEDMKSMITDDVSITQSTIKGTLLHAIKDTKRGGLLRELLTWNTDFDRNDFRALIFQKWTNEVLKAAKKDEIGDDLWDMYKKTHTYKVSTEHLITNENSVWWDNVNTDEKETRTDIIQQAFETSITSLEKHWGKDYTQWKWGNAHKLTHNHAMGEVLGFLNVGDFPVSGANEVINNMGYTYEEDKNQTIRFGPSTRRIVDFADVRNNSWSILPTGQSGNYFSPYYGDQAKMYADGEFRKMIMNHTIIQQSKNKVVLKPTK